MAFSLRANFKCRKWIIVVLVVFVSSLFCMRFQQYGHAILWHCMHGNHAQVAGHQIKVPIWWWMEKNPDHYETYLLRRASYSLLPAELEISSTLPWPAHNKDQEVLASIETSISLGNRNSSVKALVTVNARKFTVYCSETSYRPFGIPLTVDLYCESAKIPYSFNYLVSPAYEDETKSILSSLD
jgi:hypothetical protein